MRFHTHGQGYSATHGQGYSAAQTGGSAVAQLLQCLVCTLMGGPSRKAQVSLDHTHHASRWPGFDLWLGRLPTTKRDADSLIHRIKQQQTVLPHESQRVPCLHRVALMCMCSMLEVAHQKGASPGDSQSASEEDWPTRSLPGPVQARQLHLPTKSELCGFCR